jgi:anti-sigma factor RsiW
MTCDDVRPELLHYQRGQLSTLHQNDIRVHLQGCPACAHEVTADALLSEILERRLPQHAAPLGLKRRLAAQWPRPAPPRPSWWARWRLSVVPALATAAVLLIAVPIYHGQIGPFQSDRSTSMVTEAVTDHLRLLSSQHPLDIESANMHQVKPWYEGRLDFAPVVRFLGDEEFPLAGGAVGYFLDRKAAVFVFHRRLHAISLIVFPARGLSWSTRGLTPVGAVRADVSDDRGFHVILWRQGEQGYALISDVDLSELTHLAVKLSADS